MFYAIYMYMATRPRARACIFHKTLGLMLYLLHNISITKMKMWAKRNTEVGT